MIYSAKKVMAPKVRQPKSKKRLRSECAAQRFPQEVRECPPTLEVERVKTELRPQKLATDAAEVFRTLCLPDCTVKVLVDSCWSGQRPVLWPAGDAWSMSALIPYLGPVASAVN